MYARQLLNAAKLVGLSQRAIARQLGLQPTQVNLWARNKRLVPTRYREALTTLVAEATHRALRDAAQPRLLGDMVRVDGEPPQAFLDLKTRLIALGDLWEAEDLEARGFGPSASVQGVLDALEVYKHMSPAELSKSVNADRLQDLSVSLYTYATLLKNIGKEDSHDNG